MPWASGVDDDAPDAAVDVAAEEAGIAARVTGIRVAVESHDEAVVAAAMAAARLDTRIRIVHVTAAGHAHADDVDAHDADVVLVDVAQAAHVDRLRRTVANSATQRLRHLLVMDCSDPGATAVLKSTRAHGCVGRQVAPALLARALLAVAQGGLWIPRRVLDAAYLRDVSGHGADQQHVGVPAGWEDLTLREREVLNLARTGLTNKEIGRRLDISPSTVKKHLHAAYEKSGRQRRRQLLP